MAFTANEGTQTDIYSVNNGGTEIGVVKLDIGSGTALQDFGGTILDLANLSKGTVTRIEGGTVGLLTTVSNLTNGSINILTGTTTLVSTVTTLSNLTNGSVNILTGTVTSLGTAVGVGTMTNLGSLTNAGTVKEVTTVPTVTTVSNLTNGSINILTGTMTLLSTVTTVSNLTNGSVNVLTGTVTSVTNLAGGTVQQNIVPVMTTLSNGVLGTAGGSFFATLSAASGAGTKHYVTGLSVIGQAGTADIRILAGTVITGTGVIGAGIVVPGGGYAYPIDPPFQTGTNSELVYHFVGAGSAFIRVLYSKGA